MGTATLEFIEQIAKAAFSGDHRHAPDEPAIGEMVWAGGEEMAPSSL